MIVLEGQQPLGDDAHKYYDRLISQLKDDPKHVEHVQDFWGDELTRHAAQSADGKAAYVQVVLAGNGRPRATNRSKPFSISSRGRRRRRESKRLSPGLRRSLRI